MSEVLLTKEKYKELLEIQGEFDKRVPEYDLEAIKVAFVVEFIEWINTIEFFKKWKKNKGKPKEVQLDELADMLAFGLSMHNHVVGIDESFLEEIKESDLEVLKFETNLMLGEISGLAKLVSSIKKEDKINSLFPVFVTINIAKSYYTVDELIEAYYKKMSKNHERQDNNY